MKWVVKTSSVRVSDGEGDRVYRSLDDVPEELREKMRKTMDGPSSQTILIANQEAYDHAQSDDAEDLPTPLEKMRRALRPEAGPSPAPGPGTPVAREPDLAWRPLLYGGLAAIAALWSLWIWAIRSGMS